MQDQITNKEAGYTSEVLGQLNPANFLGAAPIGAAAALATKTRDTEAQAGADQDMWSNLFVPGKAPYNAAKRLGYGMRNPDLKRSGLEVQIEELENALAELKAAQAEGGNDEKLEHKELDMDNEEVDYSEKNAAENILTFIGDTSELLYELGQERDFLRNKVAALEKQSFCEEHNVKGPCFKCGDPVPSDGDSEKGSEEGSVHKTASAVPGPEREVVETTVDHLVDAKFLKYADRDQAVTAILDDPATALLSFCDKLAARRVESEAAVMPKLGHAVDEVLESDSALESRESDKAFEQRFNALS